MGHITGKIGSLVSDMREVLEAVCSRSDSTQRLHNTESRSLELYYGLSKHLDASAPTTRASSIRPGGTVNTLLKGHCLVS